MKEITARFIGENNSLGYIKGVYYTIIIRPHQMIITRKDGTGQCPYESLHSFISNWDNIKHIEI